MKKATQHNANHILFSSHGFHVEMCISESSLQAALHARYRAYYGNDSIPAHNSESFEDNFDRNPNFKVFAVWKNGEVVGTIRNAVYSSKFDWQDTYHTTHQAEDLNRFFKEKVTLLESTRFAVIPELKNTEGRTVQGILFRIQQIAQAAEKVDYLITGVRSNHKKFYEKFMGCTSLGWEIDFTTQKYPLFPCHGHIMQVKCPRECTFPYSYWDYLEIDQEEMIKRYQYLSESKLAHQIFKISRSTNLYNGAPDMPKSA